MLPQIHSTITPFVHAQLYYCIALDEAAHELRVACVYDEDEEAGAVVWHQASSIRQNCQFQPVLHALLFGRLPLGCCP